MANIISGLTCRYPLNHKISAATMGDEIFFSNIRSCCHLIGGDLFRIIVGLISYAHTASNKKK